MLVYASSFVHSQVVISNDLYTVIYSEALQQPLVLSYEVKKPRMIGFLSTDKLLNDMTGGRFFYVSTSITDQPCIYNLRDFITSDAEDYKDNDYDKGHLAPYETFKDKGLDCVLNSYLNLALMNSSLNRGVWILLEEYERTLDHVFVTISLAFDKSQRVLGGATIPTGFTKILRYYDDGEWVEEIFSFPNDPSVLGKKIHEFKIN